MSKPSSATKVKLTSIDQLMGNTNASTEVDLISEHPIEVPLSDLHEFHGHPFIVRDDDKMKEIVESIQARGVLVPGIVRVRAKGGYEIIAGHRRKRACELAGLATMPVYVRNLTDDESVIVMVDSNLQREEILPSEKAKAYKMKYEAMKHQGSAGKQKGRSLDAMSVDTGENAKKIQRYLSLARLSDNLLSLIDEKKLGMLQGVALSFLSPSDQQMVHEAITKSAVKLSTSQAENIKKLCQKQELDNESLNRILTQERKNRPSSSITIKLDHVRDLFPDDYSNDEIAKVIIELLSEWRVKQSY